MIIYGASGHGLVVRDILVRNGYTDIQFVDDADKPDWSFGEVSKPDAVKWHYQLPCVFGIGNNEIRKKLSAVVNATFVKAIHPASTVSIELNQIGVGSVVMASAVINCGSKVGRHVIINTAASVDHECVIEDFVHISPNATLCGNVSVGEGAHIGAGATIIQGIHIGKWATIGAGAVVIRDVPDFAMVVGNPAKVIRTNPKR